MEGKQRQHVIEEADACMNLTDSRTIQMHRAADACFFGIPAQACRSWRKACFLRFWCHTVTAFLSNSCNTDNTMAFSAGEPTVIRKLSFPS